MINRTLVRSRVIQAVYSAMTDGDKTTMTATKELMQSFSNTYMLYHMLLLFMEEFTRYAEEQDEEQKARARVTHKTYNPQRRFIENRVAAAFFHCDALSNYIEKNKLSWDMGHSAIVSIYRLLVESNEYQAYMSKEKTTYEDDKAIWRFIYSNLFTQTEELLHALDEMEVHFDASNWISDLDIVLSFVIKTIRKSSENEPVELLEMFDDEQETKFATTLLSKSLANREPYRDVINSHLKGWDPERVALMDRVLLTVGLTEIVNFSEIPIQISLNEYIELAKEYSTEKSHTFVNGILNSIVREMCAAGELPKAANLK